MHAAKGAQKVAHRSPTAFARVDMDFADTVAIVITCPFVLAVANGGVYARRAFIAAPFVGVTRGGNGCRRRNLLLQSGFVGMRNHRQPYLPAFASKGADDRGAIMLIRPMAFAFIGAAPRRIVGVEMRFAFFPQRSETSHRFPSQHLLA